MPVMSPSRSFPPAPTSPTSAAPSSSGPCAKASVSSRSSPNQEQTSRFTSKQRIIAISPAATAAQLKLLLEDIQNRKKGVALRPEFQQTYVTAPPLPRNYLPRPDALEALRNALLTEDPGPSIALTALKGMGGIGKTVLAQALCHDEVVQQAFPDGIIWITAGKESADDLVTRLREVGERPERRSDRLRHATREHQPLPHHPAGKGRADRSGRRLERPRHRALPRRVPPFAPALHDARRFHRGRRGSGAGHGRSPHARAIPAAPGKMGQAKTGRPARRKPRT